MNGKTQLIGNSAKFQEVLRTVELVAGTGVPVLLSGEMGTGKESFVHNIHEKSNRKNRKLVIVNCASLLEGTAEESLFGSKKSATGHIAKAHTGTLFLNNISALSLTLQQKLLHFIETGEVQTLGDKNPQQYDVRLIVATHKNLYDEASAGKFSTELYYRLNVIPVELPALKEREGDVKLLMDHFFRRFVREQHQSAPSFTKAALKQIAQYEWPGNIRELHNFCERMFILFSGKDVDVTNLPHELRRYSSAKVNSDSPFSLPATGIKLEQVEVDLIQQALQSTHGNKSKAARLLGLTRDTFLYRLRKYSI